MKISICLMLFFCVPSAHAGTKLGSDIAIDLDHASTLNRIMFRRIWHCVSDGKLTAGKITDKEIVNGIHKNALILEGCLLRLSDEQSALATDTLACDVYKP